MFLPFRYAYQYEFADVSYPLSHENSRFNMFLWPQVFCEYSDSLASNNSWCIPSPDGGAFKKNATIVIKTSHGLPVVYTTDGSVPTPESPVATGPIAISQTTTFTVQLQDPTLAPGNPPNRMTFVRVA